MRIAVLDDYQGVARRFADWSALDRDHAITVFREPLPDLDAAAAALAPFAIVCAMRERTPFPHALFARLPALELLVTTAMRNDAIDVAAAAGHGVVVCGTTTPGRATVEMTWALILAAARDLPAEETGMRAGGWQTRLGFDLAGRTLGVIGLGRLGSQVAEIGRAFRMEVLAWSHNLTEAAAEAAGARRVDKAELLARADVITLHLRLGDRSRGLIGGAELAQMKPTAWLVNTSRGPIVDEAALLDALERRAIGGAALDVFDVEPLPPDHPLRRLPNTVLSPHKGFVTEDTYRVWYAETVECIEAWLAGAPIRVIAPE